MALKREYLGFKPESGCQAVPEKGEMAGFVHQDMIARA